MKKFSEEDRKDPVPRMARSMDILSLWSAEFP